MRLATTGSRAMIMSHGNRSEEAASTALEHAAAHLRGVLRADGAHAASGPAECRAIEVAILREWTAENGLILDPLDFLPFARRGGAEHMVWSRPRERWVKLTDPGEFGCAADLEWVFDEDAEEAIQRPVLREGTPLEYLERLASQNAVFGDDIALLGVIDKRKAFHVVTSQPDIPGAPAGDASVMRYMQSLDFVHLPKAEMGFPGALTFLRESDSLAAFDCHAGNFVLRAGDVFAIDVILQKVAGELLEALLRCADRR